VEGKPSPAEIERTMDAQRQTTRRYPDRHATGDGEAGSAGALEHEASVSSNEKIGPTEQLSPLTMEVVLEGLPKLSAGVR